MGRTGSLAKRGENVNNRMKCLILPRMQSVDCKSQLDICHRTQAGQAILHNKMVRKIDAIRTKSIVKKV